MESLVLWLIKAILQDEHGVSKDTMWIITRLFIFIENQGAVGRIKDALLFDGSRYRLPNNKEIFSKPKENTE